LPFKAGHPVLTFIIQYL